jgi:hypothetical protein
MVKKLIISERNGYPDNNFTEEEYMSYVKEYKKKLQNIVNDFDNIGKKQIEINEHGDYNSILAATDKEDLFRRCALLGSAQNLVEMCELIKKK